MTAEKEARLERDLAEARAAAAANPGDEDAAIWVGRRLGYLGRYREAIAWYTEAIERFGATPKLLRHRGHRLITVREFAAAEADLATAWALVEGTPDSLEPDGIVTPAGPRSTLHGNIAYHLGLARFCGGRLDAAADAWRDAIRVATNDDSLVSATYWLAVTEFERGRPELARLALEPVRPDLDVRDNATYLSLALALRGSLDPSSLAPRDSDLGVAFDRATLGFGLAMHARHVARDETRAQQLLTETVRLPEWSAFGVIAAESVV
ncbi:MAG: hypothetical protein ACKO0W_10405, partial [Planctomycetota bacterium]